MTSVRSAWEKEEAFSVKWENGTISRNIWKYVPRSKSAAVENAFVDSDGYWIWLAPGFTAYDGGEDCGQIHELTVSDLRSAIRTIRKK